MGKIPPSFRPAISNSLIRKLPLEPPIAIPHQLPNKITKKKPPQHSKKAQASPVSRKTESLFKSPDLLSAKKVFNSIVASSKSPLDLRFHNTLLQSYASISILNDSISLLYHMITTHPSFSPDRSTYHILLSQSCKAPDSSLSPVHQTLNLMVTNGLKPNQVTTDIAIRSLCEAGRIDHAVELVKELSLKHSPPDSFTFNFLVKNLCKCRTLSTVYGFIDDMKTSFGIKPDLVTYTILIDNVCNSKNLREAMRLVGVLHESGFKPDCFVYNTIMKGYCMLSKGSEAIEVYKKMKEECVEPDLVTYNTLIFGLSKSGRVKEARKYLDIMVESGHFPDAVTYTSLMNGMCREGNALGAVVLLGEMERKGCSPNSCTYNTLLHGLCKCRLMEKAMELYGAMKSAGVKLETASYATLVRALCREGRVAEAYEVFDYAVDSKSLTDVAAYSTLEVTLKWLKKAREQGLAL
ncbi:pentatricopeptide repeat-containing protein At2g17670 [Durio zibethinus]|uniref:Pentatricopeptide repeat-containing protein At2g17670 n=1 Tax=Durio zibethinus TaxID=66656 RepID=A0A6P5YLQ7_DURZI|nr:pentatricopeptide repeat-containing protein At2g17670 [Durio zibethinus]XP_022741011.1 pentatricopeptide repeat-containing protein At2g17670 [Durio zibethinus]